MVVVVAAAGDAVFSNLELDAAMACLGVITFFSTGIGFFASLTLNPGGGIGDPGVEGVVSVDKSRYFCTIATADQSLGVLLLWNICACRAAYTPKAERRAKLRACCH